MNRPVNFSPRRRLRGKPLRNYRIWVLLALLLGLLLGGQSVQAQAWSVSASGVSSDSATIHVNNMPVSSQVSIVVFELFGGSIHCGHCPGDRNIVFRERPWFSGSRQWTISGLKPATNYQLTAQILMTDNSDAIDTNRKVARFSTAFEFPWISIDSITDTSARLNFLAIPKGTRFFDIVLSPKPTSGNWRHWLHANENEFPYSPYILKSLDPGTQYTVSVAPKNAAMPSGSSLSTSLSGIGNVFSPESVAFTTTGVKFVPTALPDNITYVLRDPGDGRIYIQITGGVAGAYAYSSSPLNCSIEAQVSFLASKVPRSISYCFGYEQPYRLVLRAYRDIGGKIGARQIEVIAEKVITGVTAARSDSPPVEPEPEELPPIAFSVGIVNSTEAT
ncbi:MAG: hypothetical protein OXG23_00705, partial [Chloroflexi bacterium]|nr:hypothetical protein [Chloroflexota bacterium]